MEETSQADPKCIVNLINSFYENEFILGKRSRTKAEKNAYRKGNAPCAAEYKLLHKYEMNILRK